MTVYANVTGQDGAFMTFGIEAAMMYVTGPEAGSVLAPFEERIQAGINAIPLPEGSTQAGLTLYDWEDTDSAFWSFG